MDWQSAYLSLLSNFSYCIITLKSGLCGDNELDALGLLLPCFATGPDSFTEEKIGLPASVAGAGLLDFFTLTFGQGHGVQVSVWCKISNMVDKRACFKYASRRTERAGACEGRMQG